MSRPVCRANHHAAMKLNQSSSSEQSIIYNNDILHLKFLASAENKLAFCAQRKSCAPPNMKKTWPSSKNKKENISLYCKIESCAPLV